MRALEARRHGDLPRNEVKLPHCYPALYLAPRSWPTQRPTLRWVFQLFIWVRLLG